MVIFDNPEFKRLVRSKLRMRSLLTYGAAALLVFGGILAFYIFIEKQNTWSGSITLARVFHPFFFTVVAIQLVIVTLFGSTLAAQNVTLEKERGTFDFQRLVAMGPWRLTLGKLFGAPAEASFMALVGVPFAAVASVGSDIPLGVLVQAETVVFVYGMVVSSFALMCSSIAEKSSQATGIVVLLGIPFYSVLNSWDAHSLWASSSPVYLLKQMAASNYTFGGGTFSFYGIEIPSILGYLTVNLLIVLLCAKITSRRIANVELSYMTPLQGIVAFAILQVLLVGNGFSDAYQSPIYKLQIFHATDAVALLLLAFALTPGAELVRGRVFRGKPEEHWKILLERNSRLQDSPALRALLEICGIYAVASAAMALKTKLYYDAALLTAMVAGLGIAMAGLLLYIQVYAERGYFKLGAALLLVGLLLPPLIMWVATLADSRIKIESVLLVSPVAYIAALPEVQGNGGELACPAICVILAVTFCLLSALRIRFLLDMQEMVRQRGLATRGPGLEPLPAVKTVVERAGISER